MAIAKQSKEMNVSKDKLWATIVNYESYPSFVENVHKVKVLSNEAGKSKVEYKIELMGKEIHYTLLHDENKKPNLMNWTFVSSNLLKNNFGSWNIQETGPDKCKVEYSIELEFNFPVPGFMLSGLIKTTLPKLLESFEKQAQKG